MESYQETVNLLTSSYTKLSPQLQKATAYILDNPGEVAILSMRKIATNADVPPPTLHRLVQTIGFESYETFRDIYRRRLQEKDMGYSEQAGQLQLQHHDDHISRLLNEFKKANQVNIEYLFASLEAELMEKIADQIISARNVYIIGMQASFSMAEYFHYVGRMGFPNWKLLGNQNADMAEQVGYMDDQDVLIAIASTPCARESIIMAQHARDRGVPVIGITNSRVTPLAVRSNHVIIVPMNSPQFFDSFVSTLVILEALIGIIVAKGGQKVVSNIDHIEKCRKDLGEYWIES